MPEQPEEPQIRYIHGGGTASARVVVESTACADSLATIIRDQVLLPPPPPVIHPPLDPKPAP